MRCLADYKELSMFGDYDTDKAANLMVVFEKCDLTKRAPGEKCKSEKQIEDWMLYKYIVLLENEAKFIQHKFGKDRVEEKSTTRFFPLNYNSRVDFVKTIFRSDV